MYGQRVDVADAAMIEIAGSRMMMAWVRRQRSKGVSVSRLTICATPSVMDRPRKNDPWPRSDRAIADYNAALNFNPTSIHTLYGRGLARQKKGEGDFDLKAAKAIDPGIVETFARYGLK